MKKSLLASTLIAATALAAPAFAANATWTGNSGTTDSTGETVYDWNDSGNWDNGWTSLDSALFTADATNTTVTVDGAISITNLEVTGGDYIFNYANDASISMAGETGSFSVDYGSSLTITGGTTKTSGTRAYINGKLTLAGGTNHFEKTNRLEIATIAGSSATLEITDGTNEFGNTYVGYDGTGKMTISGGTNTFAAQFWIGYNAGSSGTFEITGGNNQSSNTSLWIGYYKGSSGTMKISGGSTEYDWTNIHVGFNGVGTLEITGGTRNDFYNTKIYVGDSTAGASKITISGGDNNLFEWATVYVGYSADAFSNTGNGDAVLGGSGTFEISGGTTTFYNGCSIYVGADDNHTGEFKITGGTTLLSAVTTIANGSKLTIGGGTSVATVELYKQIGTSATGTVEISNNANIVISGSLLTSLEATIGEDNAWVAIITANTIIFDTLELTSEPTGEDDLDSVINQYISAGDYLLTWTWDTSDNTLYASIVGTTSVPEPGMFSVFFGIGSLGLIATRRRRRKA